MADEQLIIDAARARPRLGAIGLSLTAERRAIDANIAPQDDALAVRRVRIGAIARDFPAR